MGMREAEEGTVAVRRFGSKAQTVMPLEEFIELYSLEVDNKDIAATNE
ncbi:MAG: threonyl-tRNA synthetase [Arenicella sp.]